MHRSTLLALGILVACSSKPTKSGSEPTKIPAKPPVTIFFTTDVQGSTEPCGCTADPLGDLARTAQLIAEAKSQGPVIVADGGSTLYTQLELSTHTRAQETLKSTLIVDTFRDQLQVDAIGLGPYDLSEGPEKVRLPRQAINLAPGTKISLEPPKIVAAGGLKVGIFGVVSPSLLKTMGIATTDPSAAAKQAIADLRGGGAQIILALAHMDTSEARDFVRATPGIDFVLIGANAPEPGEVKIEPMKLGKTWLFAPANRGQVVSRLQLYSRDDSPYVDAIGKVRAALEIDHLGTEISELQKQLAVWKADANADKSFVAAKETELQSLIARLETRKDTPLLVPQTGNYFSLAQLRITKRLDCQPSVVTAKQAYDKAAGEANVKAGASIPVVPVAKGEASYVGMEECGMCHDEAEKFWQGTNHAKAWETLVDLGKEYNFDCIGCHVTGFEVPGGSNIAFNDTLRDVQCEQCHGPGSLHVAAETPKARRQTIARVPNENVCGRCHTIEHSDTFEFKAYLRDITGKGHGEEFRKTLGEGDLAHELRAAALQKAGAHIGKNCPK